MHNVSPAVGLFLGLFLCAASAQTGGDGSASTPRLLKDRPSVVPEYFSKVPPLGVHPRVLISPEDLPAIRDRAKNTIVGKWFFDSMDAWLQFALRAQDAPGKEAYERLATGDSHALDAIKDPWWRANFSTVLAVEAYESLLLQDETRGKKLAAALTEYAQITGGRMLGASLAAGPCDEAVAIAYDYNYPCMTDSQRGVVRKAVASATAGVKPYGADLPSDWRNYNWMGDGTRLVLSALAIEGEEGYDPAIYPASVQVMKDFLQYGIFAGGAPVEEMHYFHYGMGHGALALVAFARRGDNLFVSTHYRALPDWLIASMEPYGDAFSMHQDTPNDVGGVLANHAVTKWVWPKDPVVDMIWRNRIYAEVLSNTSRGDFIPGSIFARDPSGMKPLGKPIAQQWGVKEDPRTPPGDPVAGIESLHLPLSYWSPERGYLITRDKWGEDGMVLDFDMNVSGEGGGHYHSNGGEFALSALERKWAIDRGFHVCETKDNSLILIDGKGQGFFPVAGKVVGYHEFPGVTVISGDASVPYGWMSFSKNHTGAPYLKGFQFQPDTDPEVVRKWAEVPTRDPQHPWNDPVRGGGYLYRAPYNPVEKAFRTALLRRGTHSYVVIMDDIRKDKQAHQYDWLMQVADDLEVKSSQGSDVVLGSSDAGDPRRLLVRMVGANPQGDGKWILENYEVKRSPETGDDKSFGMGKRLNYECQAIDPAFKVLLYPYREGEEIPQTNLDASALKVSWPDQPDTYALSVLPSGRTKIVKLSR